MSYIGNEPTTVAFLTDTFSGNGSTVAFTMSVAPATTSSILVAITGVVQDPSTYSVVGTTLTFSAAPPSGTGNISVRYLGIPASGVTTTAYRTVTDFTATAGQTTFSVPSYTVGYIDVYRNGVRLAAADYTATNGTTVVLASGATAGDSVVTESFYVSSVLNAIPATAGAVNSTYLADGSVTTAKIADANVTAAKLASGAARANFGAGAVLQVVSMRTSTAISWSNTEQSTGLTLAITPSSASNKILVIANNNGMQSYGTSSGISYYLYRNGVYVYNIGAYYGYPNAAYGSGPQTSFLDSPATTSSVTYDIRFQRTLGSNGGVVNGDGTNSFLTLMEIAA